MPRVHFTSELIRQSAATLSYCLASMLMLYVNKWILAVFAFREAGILLIVQGIIAVLLLKVLARTVHFIELEPLKLSKIISWMPVTVLFALMLFTGSQTLAYLSIPIITVFKNMTNLLIAFGDWYWFGQSISRPVLLSFLMMVVGSVLSGYTDLQYDFVGYMWMAANCVTQAGYALYMKKAQNSTKLSEWGSAYYNNFLSIFVLGFMCMVNGEFYTVADFPTLYDETFLGAVLFSGLIGTGLSLSVFWLVKETSPTNYSMVGALNKIPVTFVSIFLFNTVLTPEATFSIIVGLASGLVYTYAKYLETAERQLRSVASLASISVSKA